MGIFSLNHVNGIKSMGLEPINILYYDHARCVSPVQALKFTDSGLYSTEIM